MANFPNRSKRPTALLLVALALGLVPGATLSAAPAAAETKAERKLAPVYRVYRAEIRRTGDPKRPLVLVAWGAVNTGGWGKAVLVPYTVKGEPNNVWRFRLMAMPPKPGQMVTGAFVNVRAELPLDGIGPHVHTFSIHAKTNSIRVTPIPKPAPKKAQ